MTDPSSAKQILTDVWEDDRLGRSKMAEFLTALVEKKESLSQNGFTLSIDAPWGSGKTFFIQRWIKELEHNNRVAIYFDAWKNDLSGSPVETFLGTLHAEVIKIGDAHGVDSKVKRGLAVAKQKTATALRNALHPTIKFALKQGFQKVLGASIDDYMEYIKTQSAEPPEGIDTESRQTNTTIEFAEEALNKYFEQALDSAGERQNALNHFRSQLKLLVEKMQEAERAVGPLYIFVDELDRCRPTYALELLEGIKHIFSVKGVVFVLSTNQEQLANSTRAVYGPAFDGHMYLKRFSDMQFALPVPDTKSYIDILVGDSLKRIRPINGYQETLNRKYGTNGPLKILAEAFELDARSIKAIVAQVDAVIAGFKDGEIVALLWLYFLAIVNYKSPELYSTMKSGRIESDHAKFISLFEETVKRSITLKISFVQGAMESRTTTAQLVSFLKAHMVVAHTSPADLRTKYRTIGHVNSVDSFVLDALMDGWNVSERNPFHPIHGYYDLIETAGYITS